MFYNILLEYKKSRTLSLKNIIKCSFHQLKSYYIFFAVCMAVAIPLHIYSILTNSINLSLSSLAIVFIAVMPLAHLRRPFSKSDSVQSSRKKPMEDIRRTLKERSLFNKDQLSVLIEEYYVDYSDVNKTSIISIERFSLIFTMVIAPFTIGVTAYLSQQSNCVIYAIGLGFMYYAILGLLFMIFQCIDPILNKENYLARDLVLFLYDFKHEVLAKK